MKFLVSSKISEHRYKTPEGYLVCLDCPLSRTGKQTYHKNEVFVDSDDNSEIEVDRTEEEVFSPQAMASFENKPICIEHPDEDVNSTNIGEYAVGFVRDIHKGVYQDTPVMMGTLVITNQDAIEKVESGEYAELSCGYDCDIMDEANPQQRNIRGNHVALCKQGRAGIAKVIDSIDDAKELKVGQKVNIKSPGHWANGEWGIVYGVEGDNVYVGIAGDKTMHLLFNKKELKVIDSINDESYQELVKFIEHKVKESNTTDQILRKLYQYYSDAKVKDVQEAFEQVINLSLDASEIKKYGFKDSINDEWTTIEFSGHKEAEILEKLCQKYNCKITTRGINRYRIEGSPENVKKVSSIMSGYQFTGELDDSVKDVNPRSGETKEEFISRFMSETKSEYPDIKQRFAVANSYWKRKDSIDDEESTYTEVTENLEKEANEMTKDGGQSVYEIDWIDLYAKSKGYDRSFWKYKDMIRADTLKEALQKLADKVGLAGVGTANVYVMSVHEDRMGKTVSYVGTYGKLSDLLRR